MLISFTSKASALNAFCTDDLNKSEPQLIGVHLEDLKSCLSLKKKYDFGPIKAYQVNVDLLLVLKSVKNKTIPEGSIIPFSKEVRITQHEIKSDTTSLSTFKIEKLSEKKSNEKPIILIRSPYVLNINTSIFNFSELAAKYDFIVILQPIRGTFLASGEFNFLDWKTEYKDATLTLNWLNEQEWSSRKVIPYGASYDGFTALVCAVTNHPSIIGVLSASSPINPNTDSLSSAQSLVYTTAYTAQLNGDSNNELYSKISKILKNKIRESTDISKLDKEIGLESSTYANLHGQLMGKIPVEENIELVNLLKKTNAPTLHSYGLVDDQDSIDVINLYRQLDGLENHFLYEHILGHGTAQLGSILSLISESSLLTRASFKEILKTFLKGKINYIALTDMSFKASTANSLTEMLPQEKMTIKGEYVISEDGSDHIFEFNLPENIVQKGPLKLKIKNIQKEKTVDWITLTPYIVSKDYTKAEILVNNSPGYNTLLTKSETEFETNSTMFYTNEEFNKVFIFIQRLIHPEKEIPGISNIEIELEFNYQSEKQ